MKKLVLFIAMFIGILMPTIAQDDIVLYIEDCPEDLILCINSTQNVIIYAQEGCDYNSYFWETNDGLHYENPLIINPQPGQVVVAYYGCNLGWDFSIYWWNIPIPSSFTKYTWKHPNELVELEALGSDTISWEIYEILWSTGETTGTIEVTEPGTYSAEIIGACGNATRTFIVHDNVEVNLATCDLETNHNMVTWPTTPEQAEYISTVKVKRDGIEVGTAPYIDGYFTDNIGSDAASRTYTVVGITPEGEECPITSYPKETIHMAYLTGMNNTIEVNWNIPTGYDLLGYNICEWNPDNKDGDLTVIDFVGAGVTSYTCSENQFDNGMVVVQGVENGRPESRLLSNRSWETVGIGEHTKQNFKIFPNPTNGSFTVEGTPTVTIYNILGQTVTTNHSENGTHTFTLRPGIYTVRNNDGIVRKVVVE